MKKVEQIDVHHGDLQVLWGIFLEIREGEIVGPIMGSMCFLAISEIFAISFGEIHILIFGFIFILIVLSMPGGLILTTKEGHKRGL